MRRAGRVNWIVIALIVAVGAFAVLFLADRGGPTETANAFLLALAKGDDKKLTELSYIPGEDAPKIEKQWEFATQVAGPYYAFAWQIRDSRESSPTTASVQLQFVRNARSPSGYPDTYELPLVKVDGKWMIAVADMDRALFPGLPH